MTSDATAASDAPAVSDATAASNTSVVLDESAASNGSAVLNGFAALDESALDAPVLLDTSTASNQRPLFCSILNLHGSDSPFFLGLSAVAKRYLSARSSSSQRT